MTFEGEILGLDLGEKRIGVARVNTTAKLPQPLPILLNEQADAKLPALIGELNTKLVVVGIPRGINGQETPQTSWAKQRAAELQKTTEVPFYWQDEAATTIKANDLSARFPSASLDSLAACIILEDFLASPSKQPLN